MSEEKIDSLKEILGNMEKTANWTIEDYVKTNIYGKFLAESHDDDMSFNIGVYQGVLLAMDSIKDEIKNLKGKKNMNKIFKLETKHSIITVEAKESDLEFDKRVGIISSTNYGRVLARVKDALGIVVDETALGTVVDETLRRSK